MTGNIYINKGELIAKLDELYDKTGEYNPLDVDSIIGKMAAADVRRNIHGEWIENDNGTYSCSLCQSWIPKEQYYYARYCLHCGADMRGKT